MTRRPDDYAAVFDGNDDPEVFILAPTDLVEDHEIPERKRVPTA